VKEADIELKPLTIFIGKNNTGKTWTAYLIAAALSSFGYDKFLSAYHRNEYNYNYIDNVSEEVVSNGSAVLDLQRVLDDYGAQFLNDLSSQAQTWFGSFFGTDEFSFEGLKMQLDYDDIIKEWSEAVYSRKVSYGVAYITHGSMKLKIIKENGDPIIKFYIIGRESDLDILPPYFKIAAADIIFQILRQSLCPRVIYLPPERVAYAALALGSGIFEDRVSRYSDIRLMDSLRLAYPISDMMDMIREIRMWGNIDKRRRFALSDPAIQKFLDAADIMKMDLLKGEILLVPVDSEIKHSKVTYQPKGAEGQALEIPAASSLVKALSPFYLYLTYIARPGDLLVIDEPEMNLHPEAQARIIELLSILANAGIKVLVTTHSPYIVDHLANLIKASELDNRDKVAQSFYLKRSEAFIAQEKVSIYLFEEGKAKNILSEDGMIDWGTFGDVSDRLSQIYFEL